MIFDSTDKKLLAYLQQDSKQTNKELSNKLELSVTAVYERIKKLEKAGFIDGYIAIVNKEKIDRNFVVFCHIKLVKHSQDFVISFEKEVNKLTEVIECYHISGDYDYLLKVIVNFRIFRLEVYEFRDWYLLKTDFSHHLRFLLLLLLG